MVYMWNVLVWLVQCGALPNHLGLASMTEAGALAARDFGEEASQPSPFVRDQATPIHESPNTHSSHWV